MEKKKTVKYAVGVLSAAVVITVSVPVMGTIIRSCENGEIRAYADSLGAWGWLFAIVLQSLQILVAFIPGEPVESGLGLAFGPFYGTLYCYIGLAIGQAAVFMLIRRYGVGMLRFFAAKKERSLLVHLGKGRDLERRAFILFLLPGTPKDLLCYLFPLTDISMGRFLIISLMARFPSVITSTWGGDMIATGDLRSAVALYILSGAVSLLGMAVYNSSLKREGKISR